MATSETTARALTDLINLNRTSVKGYQEAAEGVQSAELKAQLSQFSQQRAQFVAELEQQAGSAASHDTTIESLATDAAAAVHRGWINLKSVITGQDDSAILSECENGDAAALKAYETALQAQDLEAATKTVLEQQHSQILSAKNWVTQHKG